jgi:hypothetical protein
VHVLHDVGNAFDGGDDEFAGGGKGSVSLFAFDDEFPV